VQSGVIFFLIFLLLLLLLLSEEMAADRYNINKVMFFLRLWTMVDFCCNRVSEMFCRVGSISSPSMLAPVTLTCPNLNGI
jgi:hypothetical protein